MKSRFQKLPLLVRALALVVVPGVQACFGSSGAYVRAEHDPVALVESAPEARAAESTPPVSSEVADVPVAGAASAAPQVAAATEPLSSASASAREAALAPAASSGEPSPSRRTEPAPVSKTPVPQGVAPQQAAPPRAAQGDAAQEQAVLTDPGKPRVESDPNAPFHLEGHGLPPMLIPRDEKLVYDVILNLGVISPDVGKVTITSKVEPFRASSILLTARPVVEGSQAVISARAEGQYAVYTLDELITTAHLPQAFPALLHRSTQSGTENRRREMTLGSKDGKFVSVYRRDAHCKGCRLKTHFVEPTWAWQEASHCDGCKRLEHRIWKDPVTRDAPETCVDMLSAVYLARTMILEGRESAEFQLMDREELWDVKLKRGKSKKRIEVSAGEFDAYEVTLETRVPKTETDREEADFSGLFGIHGELSIWVEAKTGVPVWIRGVVPVGPIELDVGVELAGFRGTPREFKPIE